MGDVKLSTVVGGGGVFTAKFSHSLEVISSGATGDFKTLTPPAGQRIKITKFTSVPLLTSLTTITVGGSVVVNAVIMDAANTQLATTNDYCIENGQNEILGGVDEVFVFSTNVATSGDLELMYQEGVLE